MRPTKDDIVGIKCAHSKPKHILDIKSNKYYIKIKFSAFWSQQFAITVDINKPLSKTENIIIFSILQATTSRLITSICANENSSD